MFHSQYDLRSLFFRPASAVGLLTLKPSAHASANPVRSQGKQLACFSSPSFVLTQFCGSCSPLCRTGCTVALQLRAAAPVLVKEAISKGCWPVMCPNICSVVVLQAHSVQWQMSPEQLCSSTAVLWSELLLKFLPRDNDRHSQALLYLLFMAQSRQHILGLVLATQLELGNEINTILNELRGKDYTLPTWR